MLTQHDIDVWTSSGNVTPDRIRAMQHALRKQAESARLHAAQVESVHAAAALRGKAVAYLESVAMLQRLLESRALPRPARVRRARRLFLAQRLAK